MLEGSTALPGLSLPGPSLCDSRNREVQRLGSLLGCTGAGHGGPALLFSSVVPLVWPCFFMCKVERRKKPVGPFVNCWELCEHLCEAVWEDTSYPWRCGRLRGHMVSTPAVAATCLCWHLGMGSLRGKQELLKIRVQSPAQGGHGGKQRSSNIKWWQWWHSRATGLVGSDAFGCPAGECFVERQFEEWTADGAPDGWSPMLWLKSHNLMPRELAREPGKWV